MFRMFLLGETEMPSRYSTILAAMSIALVFFLTLSLQSYLLNVEAFGFGIGQFVSGQWLWTLGAVFALMVIFWSVGARLASWLVPLGFALAFCALIEVGPLSIGLPEVDGHISVFKSHSRQVWDLAVWIAVVALFLFFRRGVAAHVTAVSFSLMTYALAGVLDSMLLLGSTAAGEKDSDVLVPQMMSQAAVLDSVAYSPRRNVFLLIVDAASSDVVAETMRRHPEISGRFDGFVMYENNVGMHWPTRYALPGIFTGRYFEADSDMDEYRHSFIRRGSFLEDYLEADIPTFLNVDVESGGYTNRRAENAGVGSTADCRMKGAFAWTAGEISIFRAMPYVGKRHYLRRVMHRWREGGAAAWFGRDRDLWRLLSEKQICEDWPCTLQIHHSWGLHHPITFGKDGVERSGIPQTYGSYLDAAEYVFARVGEFMDGLRKLGIFESSTIFVIADHGGAVPGPHQGQARAPAPAYPLLMVKVPQATGTLVYSSLPTSHAGLSAVFRNCRDNDLTRGDVERTLVVSPRFVRNRNKDRFSEWYVGDDGSCRQEECFP